MGSWFAANVSKERNAFFAVCFFAFLAGDAEFACFFAAPVAGGDEVFAVFVAAVHGSHRLICDPKFSLTNCAIMVLPART